MFHFLLEHRNPAENGPEIIVKISSLPFLYDWRLKICIFHFTDFKQRLGVHKQTFKDPTASQTSLSKHVREIKSRGIEPQISWKLIDKGKTYSPVSGVCQLCTREAYYITFYPDLALLNAKSEIFSACRHKKQKLLIPKEKRKKKPPGT